MKSTRNIVVVAVVVASGLVGGCQKRGSGTVVIPDAGPAQYAEALRLGREAESAQKAGKKDQALKLYEQSLQSSQEIALVWHNYGMLLVERGEKMNGVEALKRAAELDTENPRPLYNIGLVYADNAQPEKALEYFRKALERDKRYLLALRGVAKMNKRLMVADEESLEQMKLALLLEKDSEWRLFFEEEKVRIDGALQSAGRMGKF